MLVAAKPIDEPSLVHVPRQPIERRGGRDIGRRILVARRAAQRRRELPAALELAAEAACAIVQERPLGNRLQPKVGPRPEQRELRPRPGLAKRDLQLVPAELQLDRLRYQPLRLFGFARNHGAAEQLQLDVALDVTL